MIWIEKGYGEMSIDLDKISINNDTVYYVKPGQALTIAINEKAAGFVISFKREFIELYEKKSFELINTVLFNQFLTTPLIKINKDLNGFMRNIAGEMLQEYRNYFDLRFEILKGFLKIFIIYLCRQFENDYHNNFQSRKMELVNTFYAELERNFATKKMVREYADLLAVTPNYLNDTVKEISGFTASYHIQQRVVLEAKRRAAFEGNSMKEIAYHLGFWDPAHFSKYFKNSSGVNFTDFKKGISGFC
jgi:AraC-like DNA-binding protein